MNASAELLKELRIDRTAPPPRGSGGGRRGLWLVIALLVALLAALAAGMWWPGTAAIAVQTTPVTPMAQADPAASVLDASGYVVARRTATVSAKITGKVREVLIEEGMHVAEGQVMATLDPIDANAQRSLNVAQLAAARSPAQGLQAQVRQAQADVARLQALVEQQLVSRAQFEQAIATRDSLRAQLDTAHHNATVARDALAIAELGVDNNIVRAPFAGIVTAKAAQPGEIVSPLSAGGGFTRTGIGTLVDMDSLEVEVEVGEAFIGRVRPQMAVETVLNAYPDWKIPSEVIAIIPTADRGKATVKVRVALKAKDARIVPEMGVRVSFLEQPSMGNNAPLPRVRVAASAITQRNGGPVAFVVAADNRVAMHPLTLGQALGKDKQVLAGLVAGQTVVNQPPPELADGSTISRTPPTR